MAAPFDGLDGKDWSLILLGFAIGLIASGFTVAFWPPERIALRCLINESGDVLCQPLRGVNQSSMEKLP